MERKCPVDNYIDNSPVFILLNDQFRKTAELREREC